MFNFLLNKLRGHWKTFLILMIPVMIYIPLFFRPIAINVHDDIAVALEQVLRLADGRFSLKTNKDALISNPIIQMLTNTHGVAHPLTLFPFFFIWDKFGFAITEVSVAFIFLLVGLLLYWLNFIFLKKFFGQDKAIWFCLFMMVVPIFVMVTKMGGWPMFAFPSFFAALYFLDVYLKENRQRDYLLFSVVFCAHIMSTPSFVLSGLFLFIYIVIFLQQQTKEWVETFRRIVHNFLFNWRIILPVSVLGCELLIAYLGQALYGAQLGVFLRMSSKLEFLQGGWQMVTIPQLLVHGLGLFGFTLFPLMIFSVLYFICRRDFFRQNVLVITSVLYFCVLMLFLIKLGAHGLGYIYEVIVPGLFLVVSFIDSLSSIKRRYFLLAVIFFFTYGQTLLYNFGYKPNGILSARLPIFQDLTVCHSFWCPYHFADPKNIGMKTLGFIFRDYLKVSPIPFTSMNNSNIKQKEMFFYSGLYQGPVTTIGRRISFDFRYIDHAKIIVLYTSEIKAEFGGEFRVEEDKQKMIRDFLQANPDFKSVAVVTKNDVPLIVIYQKYFMGKEAVFPVELYDARYDQKYSHLSDYAHIDLGY